MRNLKTATVFGRRPDPSSEHENGKETANGGVQPRPIPDASAEASIGRSEVTNGRLESEPREGDERWTEVRGTKSRVQNGTESSERKETREEQREEVATGSTRESAGGMFTKNEKPGGGPSKAPKVWWSLGRCRPKGMTKVRRIRTKVGRWNSSDEWSGMVKQSSEVMQQICSNHILTEIFGDIRICGGFKAVTQPTSCSNTPEAFGTKAEPRPRVPRGICGEGEGSGNGKQRSCRPKAGGQPNEAPKARWNRRRRRAKGMTEVRKMWTKCREVERFGNKGRRVGQSSGAMQQGCTITQPANCSSTREMSGTGRTETECSEGNFAKSCEGNRRRAPKIAGGANRGLEGSTERDSRLKRSLGDARPKGDQNPEEPEEGREIWPRPGEDVWDFGKDVRDPERPESFSGASLGNRKSQNTIRTSVRGRQGLTTLEQHQRDGSRAGVEFPDGQPCEGELTGRYRVKAERQRKGSGTSRSDRINRKVRVEAQGRRRGRSGSGGRAEWNQANPMVRNELQKSEGRGEEPRDSGDKTSEVSETTEMEERKCQGIRDPKSRRPEQIKGVRLSSLRLREEWKGGKEVVNDPDRSRSRGRAEDRRRPEISRADGEVARADRSTEGQRPEIVRTEVGGRTEGEPEVIGTESE
ncbi:hypothetical protein DFH06DRAFT_1149918 [Mycena polygramma]|nr:hypothetical protein DFH06DRAFT_1149918 [Mycena polygramma]